MIINAPKQNLENMNLNIANRKLCDQISQMRVFNLSTKSVGASDCRA